MKLDTSKPIASVSYNGVDMPIIGSVDLLWENASPTSVFEAQTVEVVGTNFDAYLVEIRTSTSVDNRSVTYLTEMENAISIACPGQSASTPSNMSKRVINKVTETSVVFAAGYGSSSTNNSMGIPTRIWGVNFTL